MKKELWRYVGSGDLFEFVKMSNDAVKQYGESFDCWYESSYVCGEEIIHYFVKLGECDPVTRRLVDAYKKQGLHNEMPNNLHAFMQIHGLNGVPVSQELGIDPANGNDETAYVQIYGRAQRGDNLGAPVKLSKDVLEAMREDMPVQHKPWPNRPVAKAPDRMLFPPWGASPVAVEPAKPSAMRNNQPVNDLGPYGCKDRTLLPVGTHSQDKNVSWPFRNSLECMYIESATDKRCDTCKHQREKAK